jgi:hypothetical protein
MLAILVFLLFFLIVFSIIVYIVRLLVPAPFLNIALAIVALIALVVLFERFAPMLGMGRLS